MDNKEMQCILCIFSKLLSPSLPISPSLSLSLSLSLFLSLSLSPSFFPSFSRLIGTGLWILSLVLFITINIVLGLFLNIYTNSPDMDSDSALLTSLRLSRVIVLEGLLLLMGLALGIFIIVVRLERSIGFIGSILYMYTGIEL